MNRAFLCLAEMTKCSSARGPITFPGFETASAGWLQATVGTLVAKILTSSTSNPYAAAGQAARTATPTALDAFSVQVSLPSLALFSTMSLCAGAKIARECSAQ